MLQRLLTQLPELFRDGWMAACMDQILSVLLHPGTPARHRSHGMRLSVRWLSCLAGAGPTSPHTAKAIVHFSAARFDRVRQPGHEEMTPMPGRDDGPAELDQAALLTELLDEILQTSEDSDTTQAFERFLYLHELWIRQYLSELYPSSCETLPKSPLGTVIARQSSVDINELFALECQETVGLNSRRSSTQSSPGPPSYEEALERLDNSTKPGATDPAVAVGGAGNAAESRAVPEAGADTVPRPPSLEAGPTNSPWPEGINPQVALRAYAAVERWYIALFLSTKMRSRALVGFLVQQSGILQIIGGIFHAILGGSYDLCRRDDVGPDKSRVAQVSRVIGIYHEWTSAKVVLQAPQMAGARPPQGSDDLNQIEEDVAAAGPATYSAPALPPLAYYESIGAAHCVWLLQKIEEDPVANVVHYPSRGHMLALHEAICTMLSELFLPWWSSASSGLVAEDYTPLLDEATCIYQLTIVQSLRVDSAGVYLGVVVDSLLTSSAIMLSEIEMVSQGDRKPRILRKDIMVIHLRRLLTTTVMGWYRMALQVSADALDDSCASIRPFLGKFARIIGEGDSHALSIWSKIVIDLTQAIVNKIPATPLAPASKGTRDGRSLRDSGLAPRQYDFAANLSPTSKGSPEPSRQGASSPRERGGSFRGGTRSRLRSHPSSTRSPATPHSDLHPGKPQDSAPSSRPLIGSLLARVTSSTSSSPWTPAPAAAAESSLLRPGLPKGRIAEVKAEFVDVSAETGALDVETLKRIWLCAYSLPGDINGMPPEMHHNCLKTLLDAHMLFITAETSGLADIYARGDPRLPIFHQELMASVKLGEPYARSRSLACQLLCKVLFRRDVVAPLPQETASAIRNYMLRILRGSDINMKQSLISSYPLFFSSGLAKALPMLFDYVSAAKAVLFSQNTVLLMSVIGDASDDTQLEAKLLSPKEAAMSILCSLACVVMDYSLEELKDLWGSIEHQTDAVDAAIANATSELAMICAAADADATSAATESGPVQPSLNLTVVDTDGARLDLRATAEDVQHDLMTTLKKVAMDLPEVQVRRCALNGLCCTVHATLACEPIVSDDSATLCLDTILAFTGNLEVGQAAVAHIDGLAARADAIAKQHPGYINTVVDVLRERIRVLFDSPQRDSAGDAALIQLLFCLRNWLVTGHVDRPNHEVAFKLLHRVCGRVDMSSKTAERMPSPPRASVGKVLPRTATLSPETRRKAGGRTGAVLPENISEIEDAIHDTGEDTPKLVMGRSPSLSRRRGSMVSGNVASSKRERRLQRASWSTNSQGDLTVGSPSSTVGGVDHVRQVAEIVVAHVACSARQLGGQLPAGLSVATKDDDAGDIATLYFACHGTVLAISQVNPVAWKVVVRSVSQRSSHVINIVDPDTDTSVGPEVSTGDVSLLIDRTRSEPLPSIRPPPLELDACPSETGTTNKVAVSDAHEDGQHQSAPAVSTVQFDFVVEPPRDRSMTSSQAMHAARNVARTPTAESIAEIAISPDGPMPVSSDAARSSKAQIPWASISELMSQLGLVSDAQEARYAPIPWTAQLQSALRREEKDPRPIRDRHKIGVIHVGPGQTTKHDMIAGQSGDSEDFDTFVAGLGSVVRVGSHTGYTGGLAPEFDQCDVPYYADYDVEAVFHVSTLMANNLDDNDDAASTEADRQERARKLVKRRWRHIGNDDVHIIWCEGRGSFNADPLASDFGIVSIVIHPLPDSAETCWVQILVKESAPRKLHGPLVHGAVVKLALLPGLIRTTALNIARQIRSEYLTKNSLEPYYVLRADWLRDVVRLQDIGAGRPVILQKATSLPVPTPSPSPYRSARPQLSSKWVPPATKDATVAATPNGSIVLAVTTPDSSALSDSPPPYPVSDEDPYGDAWAALVEQPEEAAALIELAALAASVSPQPARQPAIPGCDTSMEDGYRLKLISLFEDAAPAIEACFEAVGAAAGVPVDRFDNNHAAKGGADYAATLDFAGGDCVCESVSEAVAALRHLVQAKGGSDLTVLQVDNALVLAPASTPSAVVTAPATIATAYKELSVVCSVPGTALCVLLRVHLAALRNATSKGGAELSPASDPLRRRIRFDGEHAPATSDS